MAPKFSIKCVVPGCKSFYGKDENIKLHKIRKTVIESEKERKKWLNILHFLKEEDLYARRLYICSLHFTGSDYFYRPLNRFKREIDLKPNAVPSLRLPQQGQSGKSKKSIDEIVEIIKAKKCCSCEPKNLQSVGVQCDIINQYDFAINSDEKGKFVFEGTCDIPPDDFFFEELDKLELNESFYQQCCEQCGLLFTDTKTFREHQSVHSELSLLCIYCGEISPSYIKNVEHEYRCRIQNKENFSGASTSSSVQSSDANIYSWYYNSDIDNENAIEENFIEDQNMTEVYALSCESCFEVFEDPDSFSEHSNKHESENFDLDEMKEEVNEEWNQLQTNVEYKLSGDTTIEFLQTSRKQKNRHICHICDKPLNTEYALQRHIDTKHINPANKIVLYNCSECSMQFRSIPKLSEHIREHVAKQTNCKICNISHDNNEKYLAHLKTTKHSLLEESWKSDHNLKLFACSLCNTEGTQYERLINLAEHSYYHRVSKTRTFINGLLAQHELNNVKQSM